MTAVRLALELPVPMLVTWGADHRMFYNGGYAALLDGRHPEALGQPLRKVWPEVFAIVAPIYDRALAGDVFELPDRLLRVRRGTRLEKAWFTVTVSPLRCIDDRPCGSVTTVFDVSDGIRASRRRAAERDRAQRLLEGFLDAVPGSVYAKDRAGRMILASRRTAELAGRTLGDLIGRTVAQLVANPADAAMIAETDRRVMASGHPVQIEEALHGADGSPVTWLSTKAPLRDGRGQTIGVVGVSIDISERKATEERLRLRTAELETLIDNSPYGIAFFDRDHRFVRVNRQLATWNGHPADSHIGRRYSEIVPPSGYDIGHLVGKVFATGQPLTVEFEGVPPGEAGPDPRFWQSTFYPVRDSSGRIEAVGAWVLDISALRRAQLELSALNADLAGKVAQAVAERETALAQLHEAQKLETLGQLTGGVAHDMNNLLTPIMAGIDLLRRRLAGDARADMIAGNAMQAAERARVLVQRLLAFGRRQTLAPQLVDLRGLVEGMRDLIDRSLGPGIAVTVAVPAQLPPVRIDPHQLELALLNLAVNARDAMPAGGQLTIAGGLRAPRLPGLPPGPMVALSVADSGCGMDAATLARATEPFFTTKAMGQGTGLGLSMVHGLAAQSGGALQLESVPGRGTVATLWLPAARGAAANTTTGSASDTLAYGDGLVLLVDDEDLVRAATGDALRDAGWRVVEAASPSEALARIDAGLVPDVLVSDHMMPGMTGADLAIAARQRQPGLRVLLITGYALPDSFDTSALEVLAKPFRLADLAARLATPARPLRAAV